MNCDTIKTKLEQALLLDECIVKGKDGTFEVILVGEIFNDLSRVKKQQTVYEHLTEEISNNKIHAITIKALTPEQWHKHKNLN